MGYEEAIGEAGSGESSYERKLCLKAKQLFNNLQD